MEILWFEILPSTQLYLTEKIKTGELTAPVCVAAKRQTNGIGSRANRWEEVGEALLFSFAFPLEALPPDLKLESASIYFMYIFKKVLAERGSSCWFKWPNDIYVEDEKIAGAITSVVNAKNVVVCGVGLNLKSDGKFGVCDIELKKEDALFLYLKALESPPEWKRIFIEFKVEFFNTRAKIPYERSGIFWENATLNGDGSLCIDNKKVFSLR